MEVPSVDAPKGLPKGDLWGWYEGWAYSMVRWCLHAVVITCRESGYFTEIEKELPLTAARSLDVRLSRALLGCSGMIWITCSQHPSAYTTTPLYSRGCCGVVGCLTQSSSIREEEGLERSLRRSDRNHPR